MSAPAAALNLAPLLEVRNCCKSFRKPDGDQLKVLEDVNLTLRPGEIVGLLGRSGSAGPAPNSQEVVETRPPSPAAGSEAAP